MAMALRPRHNTEEREWGRQQSRENCSSYIK